jgi:hypothetical protein
MDRSHWDRAQAIMKEQSVVIGKEGDVIGGFVPLLNPMIPVRRRRDGAA